MFAIVLALGSSLVFGTGDYVAGVTARRVGTIAVLLLSIASYAVLGVAWVVLAGGAPPSGWGLWSAVGAGVGLGVGLSAFYRGLAVGTMAIVAPIGATGVVVPIVAGIVGGESPSPLRTAGMIGAIAGIVLAVRASSADDATRPVDARQSVQCALIAALGLGVFMWLLAAASSTSLPWAVLICRVVALPPLLGIVAVAGVALGPALQRRVLVAICATGVLTFAGTLLYAASTRHGPLSVVAVAGSLYPAVTTLLARRRLGERLAPAQQCGVAAVLAAVALMAAG